MRQFSRLLVASVIGGTLLTPVTLLSQEAMRQTGAAAIPATSAAPASLPAAAGATADRPSPDGSKAKDGNRISAPNTSRSTADRWVLPVGGPDTGDPAAEQGSATDPQIVFNPAPESPSGTSPGDDPAVKGTQPAANGIQPEPPFADPSPSPSDGIQAKTQVAEKTPGNSQQTSGTSQENPGTTAEGDTPRPSPDPQTSGEAVPVATAAFNGVTPGVSSLDELFGQWGQPKSSTEQSGVKYYLYEIAPFKHIEVRIRENKVAVIIINLENTYPAKAVAEQLELGAIRPVYVSNPQGKILGEAFPERGVFFAFAPTSEPGKTSHLVSQIILDQVSADPFILRAETFWKTEPENSVRDLEEALRLDPNAARAWWLRAEVRRLLGQTEQALADAERAIRLAPADVQFRLTYAELLGEMSLWEQAIQQLEQVVAAADQRPHLKARALCLLGDVHHIAEPPDYKKALDNHFEAVKVAQLLRNDPHPAIRLSAKQTLVDAHLGAARDIAWGAWEQKESVVPRWLERAESLAQDLVQTEKQTPEPLFRVAATALAVSVAVPKAIDPSPWIEKLDEAFNRLVAGATDQAQAKMRWDYGVALYDAVQRYQVTGQHDLAQKQGEKAAKVLEAALANRNPKPSDLYLVGRLYFRLGAVYAVQDKEHAAAVKYFDKAIPLLEQASTGVSKSSWLRLGETFVSMGFSYWESGQREQAVALTQKGLALMEQAVQSGLAQDSVLDIPRTNLRAMRQSLDKMAKRESAHSLQPSQR